MKIVESMYITPQGVNEIYSSLECRNGISKTLNLDTGMVFGSSVTNHIPYFLQPMDRIEILLKELQMPVKCKVYRIGYNNFDRTYYITLEDERGACKDFPVKVIETAFIRYLN